MTDPALRRAIEVAELAADGYADRDELQRERDTVQQLTAPRAGAGSAQNLTLSSLVHAATHEMTFEAALGVTLYEQPLAGCVGTPSGEEGVICDLIRDIFGNPFRPVAFSPSWRTEAVVGLARTMYDARDFAAMPVLADALDDAGCDHPDLLAHCRGGGPHVRGCWVVDLVLGQA